MKKNINKLETYKIHSVFYIANAGHEYIMSKVIQYSNLENKGSISVIGDFKRELFMKEKIKSKYIFIDQDCTHRYDYLNTLVDKGNAKINFYTFKHNSRECKKVRKLLSKCRHGYEYNWIPDGMITLYGIGLNSSRHAVIDGSFYHKIKNWKNSIKYDYIYTIKERKYITSKLDNYDDTLIKIPISSLDKPNPNIYRCLIIGSLFYYTDKELFDKTEKIIQSESNNKKIEIYFRPHPAFPTQKNIMPEYTKIIDNLDTSLEDYLENNFFDLVTGSISSALILNHLTKLNSRTIFLPSKDNKYDNRFSHVSKGLQIESF